MSELWEKIRARRRELDLTQQEVADYCGISVTAISKWESKSPEGRAYPRQNKLQKLSEVLQVDKAWLIDDEQGPHQLLSAIANLEEEEYQAAKQKAGPTPKQQNPADFEKQIALIQRYTSLISKGKLTPEVMGVLESLADYIESK